MFQNISMNTQVGPTAEELRTQAEEMQRADKVDLTGYNVRLYNLADTEQRQSYETIMKEIIEGVGRRTHVLFNHNREFVPAQTTWLVNLEWGEFELKSEAVKPVESSQ